MNAPTNPPRFKSIPKTITEHGVSREDPYFWLREKENPEVRSAIEAENAYYTKKMEGLQDLKAQYFESLKSMMEPVAITVPYPYGPYLYGARTPEGMQYPIYFRQAPDGSNEEVLLDVNEIARAQTYTQLEALRVSDDHRMLAYSLDTNGSEEHHVHFKSIGAPSAPEEVIEKTEGELVFAKDGSTLYYAKLNDQTRPFQIWRHRLGTPSSADTLLLEERDPRFFASLGESSDGEWIFVRLQSMESIEYRYAPRTADFTAFKIFSPRAARHEYELDAQGDRFIIQSNRDERNFILYEAAIATPEIWHELMRGDLRMDIRETCVLKNHLVVLYGREGVPSIRVFEKRPIGRSDGTAFEPDFPESIRDLNFVNNREFDRAILRLSYSSPKTPQQTLEIDLRSEARTVLHQRNVPNYDPEEIEVERVEVDSPDGVKVPISLVYRRADRGKALPTLLYGYGSYGMTTPTGFSIVRIATIRAGFMYAIAHVRGSGDLGRRWYESGKFLQKMNTFFDFQACAKGLVSQGRTPAGEITIHGGSAGGLLVTAAMNLDPSLYRGVIAEVPFTDVLSTMFDETLPLTPIEWDEWGDPRKPEFFEVMRKYSPYDNLRPGTYPYVLVNGGWNDPRVTYWEPAKFVARLRDVRQDDRITLLDIEMGAGHFGVTGRFAALEKPAEILAFLHTIHFDQERLR